MNRLALAILIFLFTASVCFAQIAKKTPVATSHEGNDQVGRSVVHALEEAIRRSQRFSLVASNAKTPKIIILTQSVDVLAAPASAIAYSIIYYRTNIPGAGVFLGLAVNSCSPETIETCAKGILPYLDGAVDFLRRHDPDLWKTL